MSDDFDDTTQILKLDLPAPTTVLIVDDDELVRARLAQLVSAAGYCVETASNGAAALRLLQTSAASVVVTDLNMPNAHHGRLRGDAAHSRRPGFAGFAHHRSDRGRTLERTAARDGGGHG